MKRRRLIPATELRVHLGEALKGLEDEDIVIVKGGVPVAMLTRYEKGGASATAEAAMNLYERALSKRAEPGGWEHAASAMERGWIGINEEELIANIYRRREEGATSRHYGSEHEEEPADGSGALSDRQRRLQQGAAEGRLIADERAEYDASGRAGD